ncbi:MAG: hypothetical protein KAH93_04265, partial [Candidatus Aenigmarchaeota archaeon]|nr:hypothetical protein [Candidatus Aenigmarchaeota archaeon]
GANVSDCVYLCNGNNDIHIAEYIRRYGGNVFGINPTHGLKEFCNDYIVKPTDKEHFGRVLEFIDNCGIVCNNTRYTLSI